MKTGTRIAIVAALAVAVIGVVALKNRNENTSTTPTETQVTATTSEVANRAVKTEASSSAIARKLPKLIDLGADKCIPCKLMAPILEELEEEYAGRMEVQFIDVWKNPDAGKQYDIEMIPTQIFYDPSGQERFRHVGFFGKEDILAKWEELGVNLKGGEAAAVIVRETPVEADTRP